MTDITIAIKTKDLETQNFYTTLQMTIAFSLLLFGAVVDNTSKQKVMVVSLDLVMTITYFVLTGLEYTEIASDFAYKDAIEEIAQNLYSILYLAGPALLLVLYIQIFNWFSKQSFALVFGFLYFLKFGTELTYVQLELEHKYTWQQDLASGIVMTVVTIADAYWFKYYPLEAGLFIGVSGRKNAEFEKFLQLQDYLKTLPPDTPLTIMELMNQQNNVENKGVTYLEVVKFTGTKLLVLVGTCQHIILRCTQNFNALPIQQLIIIGDKNQFSNWVTFYSFGTGVAALCASVLFQFILHRKLALTIVIFNTVSLCWNLYQIFGDYITPDELGIESNPVLPIGLNLFMSGMLDGLTDLFISIIGPLMIASKYRKSYEITMGGTLIAVCIALPFVIAQLFEALILE